MVKRARDLHLMERYPSDQLIAGCDEAGRGCLAGPVVAAAVVLPRDFDLRDLRDSKKLSEKNRDALRLHIMAEAIAYAIGIQSPRQIEKKNILWASVAAMHAALDDLSTQPDRIVVDGHKFIPYHDLPHECVIGGDDRYACIAAASILAKTHRDDLMRKLAQKFPHYQWESNKGYPTRAHRQAVIEHGPCVHHRRTFKITQPTLL